MLGDTVIETLEAIRLLLSVEGMAFVIAADEERVAEAIRTKMPSAPIRTSSMLPTRSRRRSAKTFPQARSRPMSNSRLWETLQSGSWRAPPPAPT
ncbi:MAG: P-loop NTPase fold protein [Actinomycetales bacterium]